jgi:VCBS repeat-containing protein/ELWxxDGT repeat protein
MALRDSNMANAAASISGTTSGTTIEDGTLLASGILSVSDADPGQSFVLTVGHTLSKYGQWWVDANGTWSYLLNNVNPSVQALGAGATLSDSFVVNSLDGSASKTVNITIQGTNDIPVISGKVTGAVTEDKAYQTFGTVVVTDIEAGQSGTKANWTGVAAHGTWSVDGKGNWNYKLNNTDVAVQALGAGETLTDSFTIQSIDGSASQVITITINGTNDVPTITGQATGNVVADGVLIATGSLVVTDKDNGQSHSQAATGAAKYGSWSVDANGHWSYQLDNANGSVQALAIGKTLTDSFTVNSQDGSGHKTVTVTITGSNHLATIAGQVTGSVTESTALKATGTLTVSDADSGEAHTKAATNVAATYGHWSVDGDGHWSYQLDQFNPTVMALAIGQKLSDSFTVQSLDGSASKLVTVTIAGNNHVPVITGSFTGNINEGTITTASGNLVVTDSDAGQSHSQAASGNAQFGTWTVDGDGHWTYQLDSAKAPVLASGQTATDSFTVLSLDGTASQVVTLTIAAAGHAATISGSSVGAVTEDGTLTASGTLTVVDADPGQSHSQTASNLATTYGHWSVDADGHWSYQLDNSNTTVQGLGAGQTLTDSFTVTSQDGSASKQVSITITGSNDQAAITGQTTGAVTEDGTLTATGTLTVSDTDAGQAHTQVATNLATTYGQWSVDVNGAWSYKLNNGNATVQALGAGQTLTDSFTVTSQDGTATKQVSITISGSNDIPVANAGTASGAEDSVLTGKLVASDVDKSDGLTYSLATGGAPAHGSVTINANGSYSYTPTANYNGSDSFTYQVSDGHGGTATAKISLTVTPVNDAPTTPTDGNAAANTVAVGAAAGTAVGITVTAKDIDSANLSYSLTNNAGGKFQIDPTTGVVTVAAGAVLAAGTYTVTAVASDGQLQSAAKDFTITVTAPANHAPTSTDPAQFAFAAYVDGKWGLWYSDINGQPALAQAFDVKPTQMLVVNDKLYITVSGQGFKVFDPATHLVSQALNLSPNVYLYDSPHNAVVQGGIIYFTANGGGATQLWSYDTTSATYAQLTHFSGSSSLSANATLLCLNGKIYFNASNDNHGYDLWSYDSSTGNASLESGIINGSMLSGASNFSELNGKIYFQSYDNTHGAELWVFDPSTKTVSFAADIAVGSYGSAPQYLTTIAGKLFFSADDALHGRELWSFDPSTNKASMIQDLSTFFTGSTPTYLTTLGGKLYFSGLDNSGHGKLWVCDPVLGTVSLAADINIGGDGKPQYLSVVDGKLLFSGDDGVHGNELWSYDPATGKPTLFADLDPAFNLTISAPGVELNGKLYFRGVDPQHGTQLWSYDPTTDTASLVRQVNPNGDASPDQLVALNGRLYFIGNTATAYNTLVSYNPSDGSVAEAITPPSSQFGFAAYGLTALDGKIYYSAYDYLGHGNELMVYDPATRTASIAVDIVPGAVGSDPIYLTALSGKLYFTASDGVSGFQLWSYDPATHTAHQFKIGDTSVVAYPKYLTALNGKLYFGATDATHGTELWCFDPATQKAAIVADALPGTDSTTPTDLTVVGGKIVFSAGTGAVPGLWVFDPSTQSVSQIPGLQLAIQLSDSRSFAVIGTNMYFTATDNHGTELWVYDAKANSAHLVQDLIPGSDGSSPYMLSAIGNKLVFRATLSNGKGGILVYDPATGDTHVPTLKDAPPYSSNPSIITALPHPILHLGPLDPVAPGNNGNSVATLVAGHFQDQDANTALGIAIVLADQTHGSWQYSLDGGAHWIAMPSVSEQAALLLAPNALVRFVPVANWAGYADIQFHAWDQSDGHHSGDSNVNVSVNGGTTALSTGVIDAQIQVTSHLTGTEGADTINGSAGNDVIQGNGGDDTIYGNAGDDTIIGGKGNDSLSGGLGADTFVFNVGDGNDTIVAGGYDNLDTIKLAGGPFYDINFGWLNQDLYVAPAINSSYNFADTGYTMLKGFLDGSSGHIAVQIDLGADNQYFGTDNNQSTFIFERGLAAEYDPNHTVVVIGTANNDYIAGGGGYYDLLFGGAGDDTITGGAGHDLIAGGDGNDSITGGKGDDVLVGGAGADIFNFSVGDGNDVIYAGGYDSQDTIKLLGANMYDINFSWSGKDLTIAQAVNGNYDFGETGSVELKDFLDGSAGHITVQIDVRTYNTFYGTDAHLSTFTFQEGLNGSNNTDHTEVLIGTSGNDTINGNGGYYDMIYAGDGNDTVNGGYGTDALHGGNGDDILNGFGGNDVLYGNAGNDTLNGGDGYDVADYRHAAGGIVVDLGAGVASNDGDGGHDILNSIEDVRGSDFDDKITGNGSDNYIYGHAGNDIISTGLGNDLLVGGEGADTLTGGGGADQFKYNAASESTLSHLDVISDFNAAEGDTINLSGLGLSGGLTNGGTGAFGTSPHVGFGGNGLIIETDGVNTRIYADTDHTGTFNAATDLAIQLTGNHLTELVTHPTAIILS